jgi:Family of unknown function (DUF5636)
MKQLSPQEIGAEIRQHFPHFAALRFAQDSDIFSKPKSGAKASDSTADTRVGSDVFHDYCQIGALLTDSARCHKHLMALDSALRSEMGILPGLAGAKKIPTLQALESPRPPDSLKAKLPGPKSNLPREKQIEAAVDAFKAWRNTAEGQKYSVKFNSVLQRVLQRQEERYGFKGAQLDDELEVPVQNAAVTQKKITSPVLTGFVKAPAFKAHLLQQKRHWKDPGARPTHGEFTHRLQWWIVMQEKDLGSGAAYPIRGDVSKRFAQLVKYPYHPEGVGGVADKDGRMMWDYLFDCFTNGPPRSADSYRTPDNLHSAVMSGVGGTLLQAMIVARHNKRMIMIGGIGGKALDDYEAWKVSTGRYTELKDDDDKMVQFIVKRTA